MLSLLCVCQIPANWNGFGECMCACSQNKRPTAFALLLSAKKKRSGVLPPERIESLKFYRLLEFKVRRVSQYWWRRCIYLDGIMLRPRTLFGWTVVFLSYTDTFGYPLPIEPPLDTGVKKTRIQISIFVRWVYIMTHHVSNLKFSNSALGLVITSTKQPVLSVCVRVATFVVQRLHHAHYSTTTELPDTIDAGNAIARVECNSEETRFVSPWLPPHHVFIPLELISRPCTNCWCDILF